eukprot:11048662-Ditylum_brightwellii.AAC.1
MFFTITSNKCSLRHGDADILAHYVPGMYIKQGAMPISPIEELCKSKIYRDDGTAENSSVGRTELDRMVKM